MNYESLEASDVHYLHVKESIVESARPVLKLSKQPVSKIGLRQQSCGA